MSETLLKIGLSFILFGSRVQGGSGKRAARLHLSGGVLSPSLDHLERGGQGHGRELARLRLDVFSELA